MGAEELAAEAEIRERFVRERLTRPASPSELKDLTDFFHSGKSELLRCTGCGQLQRRELEKLPAAEYAEDEYDPGVIDAQYPKYLNAFRAKAELYRPLLERQARVVEVGSHYGAFLQTATEWGWQIEGVDVGEDTSRYAESKGFLVHRCELQDCGFEEASFHGVFVWNCFEQIGDPKPLLEACRKVLKQGGLLVLRTPNAVFYERCRELLAGDVSDAARAFLIDALGYNNLLGFPYLFGYSGERLARCAGAHGFEATGMVNSELITLPLPQDPDWVKREERSVNAEVSLLAEWTLSQQGVLTGPWIECRFRKS